MQQCVRSHFELGLPVILPTSTERWVDKNTFELAVALTSKLQTEKNILIKINTTIFSQIY